MSSFNEPIIIGGTSAPPLDAAGLETYRSLAKDAPPQVAEAMNVLIEMMEVFHARPDAKGGGKATAQTTLRPHPSGLGMMAGLPDEEVERLRDVVPWQDELDMYATLFDRIDNGRDKPLRDAAFHLLWFGRELFIDREPITTDKLQAT